MGRCLPMMWRRRERSDLVGVVIRPRGAVEQTALTMRRCGSSSTITPHAGTSVMGVFSIQVPSRSAVQSLILTGARRPEAAGRLHHSWLGSNASGLRE